MNIELALLDQQVQGLAKKFNNQLDSDENKQVSKAFLALAIKTLFDVDDDEIIDCIYDSGNDYSIDSIYISDIINDSFSIKIIQSKYKRFLRQDNSYYDGDSKFPRTDVEKMLSSLSLILDPNKDLINLPIRLKTKITEIKELLQSGIIPRVDVYFCNNGLRWDEESQNIIDSKNFPDWINFHHFNHNSIINILRAREDINDTIQITGKAIVEDFDYARVMIGKVRVEIFAELFKKYGDKLLEKNVRKYLGSKNNRVNEAIKLSLLKDSNSNFFFLNNGITMIVSDFTYNAMQERDYTVNLKDIHIINGGQTCKTIEETVLDNPDHDFSKVFVLVRIYKLSKEYVNLINEITYATNSQTAINLRDLKSNDDIQKSLIQSVSELEKDESQEPVYTYKPKRDDITSKNAITIAVAAEAILSVWNQEPHVVKFKKNRLFEDAYYNKIFTQELNGAKLVLAVLIWRYVETKRKAYLEELFTKYPFIGYASNILAMTIGILLLKESQITQNQISHINFKQLKEKFEVDIDKFYKDSLEIIKKGLQEYENIKINLDTDSLQRIAGAFRSGFLTKNVLDIINKNKTVQS